MDSVGINFVRLQPSKHEIVIRIFSRVILPDSLQVHRTQAPGFSPFFFDFAIFVICYFQHSDGPPPRLQDFSTGLLPDTDSRVEGVWPFLQTKMTRRE